MQTLTADEIRILKSRLTAGADGHRQQVVMTGYMLGAATVHDFEFPTMVLMTNGQPGMLVSAHVGTGTRGVYFVRYQNENRILNPVLLFAYDTYDFSIVNYLGKLVAIARNTSTSLLRARVSIDNGNSWGAEFTLIAALPARVYTWNASANPALRLFASRDGSRLYLFYQEHTTVYTNRVMYRTTTNIDPALGWSAEAYTGFTVPSLGRNATWLPGRAFSGPIESKTAGTWVIGAESDDGDFHANHAIFQGTLGGSWTRRANFGYGGGLSGGQGDNGGLFYDRNGDLIWYMIQSFGDEITSSLSTDSGTTWGSGVIEMSAASTAHETGDGDGLTVPGYPNREFIWGGIIAGGGNTDLHVVKVHLGTPNDFTLMGDNAAFDGVVTEVVTDISDRVTDISTDKSLDLDSDTVSFQVANADGHFSITDQSAALYPYAQPDSKIEVFQWYGTVANKLKTFTGYLDASRANEMAQMVTVTGRDVCKKLLTQEVDLIASQDITVAGSIRTTDNYVYLNKTLEEVLYDLIVIKAFQPSSALQLVQTGFIFRDLEFGDSQKLMDCVKRACTLAGVRFWADENGNFRTALIDADQAVSGYTAAIIADVPTSFYRLSDTTRPTALDTRGAGNGTYAGSVTLGQPGVIAGDPDRAVALDGTIGTHIDLGDRFDFTGTAAFTFECWVRPSLAAGAIHRRIVSKEFIDGGGRQGWAVALDSGGLAFERWHNGAVDRALFVAGIPVGATLMLTCTYDGTSMRLYLNGGLVAGPVASSASLINGTNALLIGEVADGSTGAGYAGLIDEVAFYPAALTAGQITAHYNAGFVAGVAYTFRAREDITSLDPEITDDFTKTRVKVIGRANLGGKYLKEQFSVEGLGQPAAIEYDPTTGNVWYGDTGSQALFLLDPRRSYAVVQRLEGIAVSFDGITVDVDNNVWISDGQDPTVVGPGHKKVNRSTGAVMLGPFANPDGNHCGIHEYLDTRDATRRLLMTTLTSAALVRMNKNGTEHDRVASPALSPSAITADGGGGYYLTSIDPTQGRSFYQIDFAGSIITTIASAYADGNEMGWDATNNVLYMVFRAMNRIVVYAVDTSPAVTTATIGTWVDDALERKLGERRVQRITDMAITDNASAQAVAGQNGRRLALFRQRTSAGVIANPALQKDDRITVNAPGSGIIAGAYTVISIRTDQRSDGSFLSVLVIEPVRQS